MRWLSALVLASACLVLPSAGRAETPAEQAAAAPQSAAAPSAAAPLGTAPTPTEEAKIEGFRSAAFGMTEAQVRQAIRKDFPGPGEKITNEPHASEKTTVLTVQVPDLIPGAGRARVAYIIGYTTKKLIQVNVTWTAEAKSAGAEGVVGAANLLRNHFLAAGYQPNSILANQQMPHGFVVFRGLDAGGRMVMLMLAGAVGTEAEKEKTLPPITLQLSYVLDPQQPDIYRVPKGQF